MRLDTSQHMRLEQKMKLAPRMIQSMEILQLPLLALQERIDQELESNPVLEVLDPAEEVQPESPEPREDPDAPTDGERDMVVSDDDNKTDAFERLSSMQEEDGFGEYMDRAWTYSARQYSGERDRKLDAMMNTASRSECLNDHLLAQWAFVETDEPVKLAGKLIIDHIGDDGYLRVRLEDLVEDQVSWARMAYMEEALRLVQQLEPVGVGARDLGECLLIQLNQDTGNHALEKLIVSQHLRDIELNRLPQVAKKTGESMARIKEAIVHIGRLTRRPGMLIGDRSAPYIMPDVVVEYDEEGTYQVRLSDELVPRLQVSNTYRKMVRERELDTKTRQFIQTNMRSARWLIESIEQRRHTLLRVVGAILKHQHGFLERGPEHLMPLPMVQVADELGIHVGTVSRAVAGKYMQTPQGIFALRQFFCGGTETADGQSISWGGIKVKLQEIIDGEDKANPLNDDQIVTALKGEGLGLARRTVAKYRKIMEIPSARQRRQY